MTSKQMEAFKVNKEPKAVRERYGNAGFGRGCLMARRLVEAGVPFVEVDLGGWDNHANIFPTLQNQKLPELDKAMSALVEDLAQRGLLDRHRHHLDGRVQPHAADQRQRRPRPLGAQLERGRRRRRHEGRHGRRQDQADGTEVETEPYTSQDVMATVCKALGISLETTFTSKNGRPMKIANSGKVIKELFA